MRRLARWLDNSGLAYLVLALGVVVTMAVFVSFVSFFQQRQALRQVIRSNQTVLEALCEGLDDLRRLNQTEHNDLLAVHGQESFNHPYNLARCEEET